MCPSPSGPVPEEELDAVVHGSRVITAVVAGSLARSGDAVTVLQLRVLVLADTRPGISATDLAEALGVHVSSASRTVDRLVTAGMLERREAPDDRRRLDVRPTAAGQRLLRDVMDDRRRELRRLLEEMSSTDRDHLARGMAALAEAAGEPPVASPLIP